MASRFEMTACSGKYHDATALSQTCTEELEIRSGSCKIALYADFPNRKSMFGPTEGGASAVVVNHHTVRILESTMLTLQ